MSWAGNFYDVPFASHFFPCVDCIKFVKIIVAVELNALDASAVVYLFPNSSQRRTIFFLFELFLFAT